MASQKLKSGNTVSCGCRRAEGLGDAVRKHGLTDTRAYKIWCKMKERCNCPTCPSYPRYGGRGITVCSEWNDDFQSFYDWAMSHGYEDSLTIDRIDNDGNYEPDNCRWITKSENSRKRMLDEHQRRHGLYHGLSPDGVQYDFIDAKAFGEEHGLKGPSIRSAIYHHGTYKKWTFWTDK